MNGVTGAASDVASAGAGAVVGPLAQLLGGEQVETLKATLMIAGGAMSFTYLHTIAGPRISRVDLDGKDETKLTTAFNSPSSPSSARSTSSFVEALDRPHTCTRLSLRPGGIKPAYQSLLGGQGADA